MALTKVSRGLLTTSIVDNGNATAITIDASENVGIGASPATQLFVKSASNAANVFAIESADALQRLQLGVNTSNGGSYIFEQKAQALRFGTSDTERMIIDQNGWVNVNANIATDNPADSQGLHFGWNYSNAEGESLIVFNKGGGSVGGLLFSDNSADGTPVERMRIDSTGSIISSMAGGVFLKNSSGGTSATQILVSNTGGSMRAGVESSSGGTLQIGTSAYAAVFGNQGNYPTQFTTNGAVKATIDSSGRLLVNTTSILTGSSAKLQVLQDVTGQWSQRINNSAADPYGLAISYTTASPNSTYSQFHYCVDSTGARWGVYSNGGVLNYSGNNVNLSDRNAKKDITLHTDNEWDCVKAWEIVDYRYKDEADDSPAKIGVIAQQIQEHCPDLVNVFQEQADAVEEVLGEDGEVVTEAKAAVEKRIGVNEAQMMWKVTKALQEAMERIETLEAKVQTLENN